MKSTPSSPRTGWLSRVETLGNRLPHPTLLFVYLCAAIVVVSALATAADLQARHPSTGDDIIARSLLSGDGIRWALANTVGNFVGFAPVGTVLVAIMGIGVAEHSGLLGTVLRALVLRASGRLLTAAIVLSGVLSSIGADAGYVVLIPLAGLAFRAAGRHPLAGIAAAFAGVSGGFSANLMIGPIDAILSGLSTEALHLVNPAGTVQASDNYYFMIVSTVFLTAIGTWVTSRWVEPRLGGFDADTEAPQQVTSAERRGLRAAGWFTAGFAVLLLWATLPESALLRHPETGSLVRSPFIDGIVTLIAVYAALAGIVYGRVSGHYRSSRDWIEGMENSMATMATYLVLMFFAAQFVNYFAWSNLGAIFAVKGAAWLASLELSRQVLLLAFIVIAAGINLLIGSASAKWSVFAPVFIPMLYLVGVSPEAAQMAYRIGDSSTNIITPLMPYFALVLGFARRYQPEAGVGTLIALMLPFSLWLLAGWSVMLALWIGLGWPFGP